MQVPSVFSVSHPRCGVKETLSRTLENQINVFVFTVFSAKPVLCRDETFFQVRNRE